MKINIDKLMISVVMILAVCLYAPTMLKDYKAKDTTDENVTEVYAEASAPVAATYVKTFQVERKPSLMAEDEMLKAQIVRDNYDDFLDVVEDYYAEETASQPTTQYSSATTNTTNTNVTGDGVLTASKGVNYGPSGKETYYNLNMSGVVDIMESMGYNEEYWVREDGVKMYGDYVMVAADLNTHPRGSIVESSLGTAIVVDTGGFAASDPNQLDIATSW